MLKSFIQMLGKRARERRRAIFLNRFSISHETRILDIGGYDGTHIASVLEGKDYDPENIYVADINKEAVQKANAQFGFYPVILNESGSLPFDDGFFDIIFCSSVIEHVTLPKERIWECWSGRRFAREAAVRQELFAAEIRRLGRGYFVQTPNKWFPIESHTWLPFISYLPRWLLIPVLRSTNRLWVKKTSPDWRLLGGKDLKNLFPDAEILKEKWGWMIKSIMAVKISEK